MSNATSLQAELDELSHQRDQLAAKLSALPKYEPEKSFGDLEEQVQGWATGILIVIGIVLLNTLPDKYDGFIILIFLYPGEFIIGYLISLLFVSVAKKLFSRGYEIANGRIRNRRRMRKEIDDQLKRNEARTGALQYQLTEIQFEREVNDWMHTIRDGSVDSGNERRTLDELKATFARLKRGRLSLHGKVYYESRMEAIANFLEGKPLVPRTQTSTSNTLLRNDNIVKSKPVSVTPETTPANDPVEKDIVKNDVAKHTELSPSRHTAKTNNVEARSVESNTSSLSSTNTDVDTTLDQKEAQPPSKKSSERLQLPIQFLDNKEDDIKVEHISAIISSSSKRNKSLADRKPESKIDYQALQEARWNIGALGEEFVVRYERQRLEKLMLFHSAANVKRVSVENDSLGYDIVSFNSTGDPFYIEVKTTCAGKQTPFFIGATEFERLKRLPGFAIYRVYDFDVVTEKGSIIIINGMDDLEKFFEAEPWQYVLSLKELY